MAFQLELPDIGEGVVEAEVQRWFVQPGDEVAEDQPLVEVMTDKATVVIPSPRRGRVVRLFWKVGDVAKVHAPLIELETEAEAAALAAGASGNGAGRAERTIDHSLSPAPAPAGTSQSSLSPAPAPAGTSQSSLSPAPAGERAGERGPDEVPRKKALATPAVRAMAREMGVSVDEVAGTGPGGRVTKDDLAAVRGKRNGHAAPPASIAAATAPSRPAQPQPAEERIALHGVLKRMAEHMARAKRTAAHFTYVEQCDATELVRVKDRMAAAARDEGAKITFLPFVLKAAVAALEKHPRLNATMDEERGELVLHRRYDIGVAAASDAGLIVPVVRGVDGLSLLELAREIERLAAATREGHVRPEDLGRSTFTVTSLGALGGLFATPVLNHPEVAILGIHRIRPTPVARDGQVVIRDVMHVSVTCDHRVVDGHEAAAFATEVIRHLENPDLLFMRMA